MARFYRRDGFIMACKYCTEGAFLESAGFVSDVDDDRVVDAWIDDAPDGAPSLMVRTWLGDGEALVAEYPVAFCPVCGRNMLPSEC